MKITNLRKSTQELTEEGLTVAEITEIGRLTSNNNYPVILTYGLYSTRNTQQRVRNFKGHNLPEEMFVYMGIDNVEYYQFDDFMVLNNRSEKFIENLLFTNEDYKIKQKIKEQISYQNKNIKRISDGIIKSLPEFCKFVGVVNNNERLRLYEIKVCGLTAAANFSAVNTGLVSDKSAVPGYLDDLFILVKPFSLLTMDFINYTMVIEEDDVFPTNIVSERFATHMTSRISIVNKLEFAYYFLQNELIIKNNEVELGGCFDSNKLRMLMDKKYENSLMRLLDTLSLFCSVNYRVWPTIVGPHGDPYTLEHGFANLLINKEIYSLIKNFIIFNKDPWFSYENLKTNAKSKEIVEKINDLYTDLRSYTYFQDSLKQGGSLLKCSTIEYLNTKVTDATYNDFLLKTTLLSIQ